MLQNTEGPRLLGLADVARLLYGEATVTTKARVKRLVDRGELRAVRIGERGDRWVPREAIEALLAGTATGARP